LRKNRKGKKESGEEVIKWNFQMLSFRKKEEWTKVGW